MKKNIINLTPHAVHITTTNGIAEIPASGWELRLETNTEFLKTVATQYGEVKTTKTVFGAPVLVESKGGAKIEKPDVTLGKSDTNLYIVSQIALNGLANNPFIVNWGQFVVPAEVQRDETGRITHCLSFGV